MFEEGIQASRGVERTASADSELQLSPRDDGFPGAAGYQDDGHERGALGVCLEYRVFEMNTNSLLFFVCWKRAKKVARERMERVLQKTQLLNFKLIWRRTR